MIGAIIGDICGSRYEWDPLKDPEAIRLDHGDTFTDDTVCTLAVFDHLHGGKPIVEALRELGTDYFTRGYGLNFLGWLCDPDAGPYGSWGNGSAMRVSPAAYFASSIKEAAEIAQRTAEVTHNHWQGIRGAQATAVAIRMALEGWQKQDIKDTIERAYGYDLDRRIEDMRQDYEFRVSCQESVPESIIAFLDSYSYEDAIRLAISMGGDADTMACIAGGIAGAYYGIIPDELYALMEDRLTVDLLERVRDFEAWLPQQKFEMSDPWALPDFNPPNEPVTLEDGVGPAYEREMAKIEAFYEGQKPKSGFSGLTSTLSCFLRRFGTGN